MTMRWRSTNRLEIAIARAKQMINGKRGEDIQNQEDISVEASLEPESSVPPKGGARKDNSEKK